MPDSPRSVMLFAAGFGTRMGALTAERPKPMIEVAGRPLIDHALSLVRAHRPDRIVANVHYRPDPLIRHLEGSEVIISHETPDILETGGGLRAALPHLGEGPVFTMNTDAVWSGPNPLDLLFDLWQPARMDALLLCVPRQNAIGHGGQGDFVVRGDAPARRGPGQIYTGLQILRTDVLNDIPNRAFSLNVLWDRMLTRKRLFAASYPGRWCDVGRPEGIALAEEMLGYRHV
ncbi:MAG: nucleotidyltransferase family protein [Pseudomonadota bacterium]|uniref:nucleotidyltransferase family protein n=2 Tax=Roseovarius TaxID=74030 RepID=UPI0022A73611|nr:nucleotidyltransferase family protein [Roseovarius sp. EGI FJ00037]MCZ0811264.1 nucleotidyltransferase family protein [Roseovarius sp. EGI FJ00037]